MRTETREFYCRNEWLAEPVFETCDRQCLDCRLASLEMELHEQSESKIDEELESEVSNITAKAILIIAGAAVTIVALEILHFALTLAILNKL